MFTKKIGITTLLILIVAVSASAVTTVLFNRNQIVWMSPLFNVGGAERLPYTTYYIQDKMNRNTCIFVLVDNVTKQFSTTAVHYASCPPANAVEFNAFMP